MTRSDAVEEFAAWREQPRRPGPFHHALVDAICRGLDVPVRLIVGTGKRGTPAKRQRPNRHGRRR